MCFMVIGKTLSDAVRWLVIKFNNIIIKIFINEKFFIMQSFAIVCLLIEITKEKSTLREIK